MSALVHGVCGECDDPVGVGPTGWYRCRSCGFESLRTSLPRPVPVSVERRGEAAALGLSLYSTSDTGSAQ